MRSRTRKSDVTIKFYGFVEEALHRNANPPRAILTSSRPRSTAGRHYRCGYFSCRGCSVSSDVASVIAVHHRFVFVESGLRWRDLEHRTPTSSLLAKNLEHHQQNTFRNASSRTQHICTPRGEKSRARTQGALSKPHVARSTAQRLSSSSRLRTLPRRRSSIAAGQSACQRANAVNTGKYVEVGPAPRQTSPKHTRQNLRHIAHRAADTSYRALDIVSRNFSSEIYFNVTPLSSETAENTARI